MLLMDLKWAPSIEVMIYTLKNTSLGRSTYLAGHVSGRTSEMASWREAAAAAAAGPSRNVARAPPRNSAWCRTGGTGVLPMASCRIASLIRGDAEVGCLFQDRGDAELGCLVQDRGDTNDDTRIASGSR